MTVLTVILRGHSVRFDVLGSKVSINGGSILKVKRQRRERLDEGKRHSVGDLFGGKSLSPQDANAANRHARSRNVRPSIPEIRPTFD